MLRAFDRGMKTDPGHKLLTFKKAGLDLAARPVKGKGNLAQTNFLTFSTVWCQLVGVRVMKMMSKINFCRVAHRAIGRQTSWLCRSRLPGLVEEEF